MSNVIDNMSAAGYEQYFRKLINSSIETVLNMSKGHATSLHTALEDRDMIERMIKEEKPRVSCFYSQEEMKNIMKEFMEWAAKKISIWMTSENWEVTEGDGDYNKLILTAEMGEDNPIGHGFDLSLKEKVTDYMTVVLCRDNSPENILGFYVKTAYPDIRREYCELGKVAYNEKDILYSSTFLPGYDFEKTLFATRKYFGRYRPQSETIDGVETITISHTTNRCVDMKAIFKSTGTEIEEYIGNDAHEIIYNPLYGGKAHGFNRGMKAASFFFFFVYNS